MRGDPTINTRRQLQEFLEANPNPQKLFDQELTKVAAHALTSLDLDAYEELKAFHMSDKSQTLEAKYKYFDLLFYLRSKLKTALRLGIHNSKPLRILDIGTGPAHFPFICNFYGHETLAIDIPDGTYEGCIISGENAEEKNQEKGRGEYIYKDIVSFLGVNRKLHRIEPYKPLPDFGMKFHLITAFMINFNKDWWARKLWDVDEWTFFLDDVWQRQLESGGRVFFGMNRAADYKGLQHDSAEFVAFMESRGAAVNPEKGELSFGKFEKAA